MDVVFSLIAFFALVVSWFVLPAVPRSGALETSASPVPSEALAQAA